MLFSQSSTRQTSLKECRECRWHVSEGGSQLRQIRENPAWAEFPTGRKNLLRSNQTFYRRVKVSHMYTSHTFTQRRHPSAAAHRVNGRPRREEGRSLMLLVWREAPLILQFPPHFPHSSAENMSASWKSDVLSLFVCVLSGRLSRHFACSSLNLK